MLCAIGRYILESLDLMDIVSIKTMEKISTTPREGMDALIDEDVRAANGDIRGFKRFSKAVDLMVKAHALTWVADGKR